MPTASRRNSEGALAEMIVQFAPSFEHLMPSGELDFHEVEGGLDFLRKLSW
jgi:hypothetical protein